MHPGAFRPRSLPGSMRSEERARAKKPGDRERTHRQRTEKQMRGAGQRLKAILLVSWPEKVQPPASAGYEGLLFPPEQSVKVTGKSFLKQALISNTNFKILLVGQVCKMQ